MRSTIATATAASDARPSTAVSTTPATSRRASAPTWRAASGSRRPTTTVSHAADAWLTAIKATDLKPNTIDAYEDSYRVHLEPRFGRRRLDAITVQDLAVFLADAKTVDYRVELHTARYPDARKRPTKPYAARSIRLTLTTLSQIYKHARRFDGYAGEPPTDALLSRERPKIVQRPKVVLTPEQTGLLVVATPARYADATAFLAGTGVRIGEALALPWCELDLDNRLVTIRWTLTDDGDRDTPKWEHCIRTITINGALAARLAALKLATRDTSPDAPVFQTTAGTAMNRHNITRRGLWVACAAAGLPRISPHSLRHGHGSALLEQGWALPDVSARLGHKNSRVTSEVYAHELKALSAPLASMTASTLSMAGALRLRSGRSDVSACQQFVSTRCADMRFP
jgi:integrase